MNLQLPLKGKWFEMTNPDEKTEDYREITPYWVNRLTQFKNGVIPIDTCVEELKKGRDYAQMLRMANDYILDSHFFPKLFAKNIMTLGYPKSTDISRVKIFEHAGIAIRTGNTEWGAEPDKLYFVIKHGKRLQ